MSVPNYITENYIDDDIDLMYDKIIKIIKKTFQTFN